MKTWSRNALKYIAVAAMLSDHVAMMFLAEYPLVYFIMRLFGRLTAPVMCFFIAEGFYYTRSRFKYGLRLAVFALISQLAYTYAGYGTLLTFKLFSDWNVIFTLFIGFCILSAYEKIKNKPVKWGVIGLLCAASCIGDWMIVAPLWILSFYIYRNDKKRQFMAFGIIAAFEVVSCVPFIICNGELWQIGVFLVIPLLLLYNERKGGGSPFHKWIFYLFYPLHLAILGFIQWALMG